jgi:nucleoside 2-deoxyribosyltransferase
VNCLVIMPFDHGFDDVYAAIKTAVGNIPRNTPIRCFRIDEARPAGRITERLLTELRSSSVCIADLTGSKPNVMWEVGYAMALEKPLLIITQKLSDMPFDLKDMQNIEYDRNHLSHTLGKPLTQLMVDTLTAAVERPRQSATRSEDALNESSVQMLQIELAELKGMVGELVRAWNPSARQAGASEGATMPDGLSSLSRFEGAWLNIESGSHLHAKVVNGDLLVPYCFGGDDHLTGVYYGWTRIGEYWFARFAWAAEDISGFAFLKEESADSLVGAWWLDEEVAELPNAPPERSGVPARLQRLHGAETPGWAQRVFVEANRGDVIARLARP